jgi:hypothetical protein
MNQTFFFSTYQVSLFLNRVNYLDGRKSRREFLFRKMEIVREARHASRQNYTDLKRRGKGNREGSKNRTWRKKHKRPLFSLGLVNFYA